jgi:hypothetical protein
MNTTTNSTAFHPYRVLQQERGRLQLHAPYSQRVIITFLRYMPLIIITIGLVLYLTQKEIVFLPVFCGMGLLIGLIFVFIEIPASVSMDSMGFTLETLLTKGRKETNYLWNDVDFIRHKVVRAKNSISLTYDAVLKTGKKVSFLTFANYHQKVQAIPEINAALHNISNKEIREK